MGGPYVSGYSALPVLAAPAQSQCAMIGCATGGSPGMASPYPVQIPPMSAAQYYGAPQQQAQMMSPSVASATGQPVMNSSTGYFMLPKEGTQISNGRVRGGGKLQMQRYERT